MSYRWIACLALVGLPGVASAQEPADLKAEIAEIRNFAEVKLVDGPIYQIELLIVEGDFEGFEREANRTAAPRDLPRSVASFDPPAPVSFPAETPPARVAASPAALPHPVREPTTKADPVRLLDLVPTEPKVDVLAAPRLSVAAGQEAAVQVRSQASFEYLEPAGEETFRLRRSEPCALGILLKATAAPAEDDPDAVVISPLQIEVTSLDGRESVKGIGLEVGKPIISSRSLKTSVRLPLGEERIVEIPSVPNREAAVILRVTRIEDEAETYPRRK